MKKKVGLRYAMNVVPLDPTCVRGTHGRLPDSADDAPLLLCSDPDLAFWQAAGDSVPAAQVRDLVLQAAGVAAAGPRRLGVRAMSTTLADEQVVLLDADGTPIGTMDKSRVHTADTPLHLAFSCYAFDSEGRMLLTRRSLGKRTWPGVWTNTCCGHPAPGEDLEDAIRRRLRFELGVEIESLRLVLPGFRYRAVAPDGIVENEVCPVFFAQLRSDPATGARRGHGLALDERRRLPERRRRGAVPAEPLERAAGRRTARRRRTARLRDSGYPS